MLPTMRTGDVSAASGQIHEIGVPIAVEDPNLIQQLAHHKFQQLHQDLVGLHLHSRITRKVKGYLPWGLKSLFSEGTAEMIIRRILNNIENTTQAQSSSHSILLKILGTIHQRIENNPALKQEIETTKAAPTPDNMHHLADEIANVLLRIVCPTGNVGEFIGIQKIAPKILTNQVIAILSRYVEALLLPILLANGSAAAAKKEALNLKSKGLLGPLCEQSAELVMRNLSSFVELKQINNVAKLAVEHVKDPEPQEQLDPQHSQDMEELLADEMQSLMKALQPENAQDPAYQHVRKQIQTYIESLLVTSFLRMMELNGGNEAWFDNMIKKLELTLASFESDPDGATEDLMNEILGIGKPSDLSQVPQFLQSIAHQTIKDHAYEILSAMAMTLEQAKGYHKAIRKDGGGNQLNQLCDVIVKTKDDALSDPANIVDLVPFDATLKKTLLTRLKEYINNKIGGYKILNPFINRYLDGILARVMAKFAVLNPPITSGVPPVVVDSFQVGMKKALEIAVPKLMAINPSNPADKVIPELVKEIRASVFGIEGPKDLDGVPPVMQSLALNQLDKFLSGMIVKQLKPLEELQKTKQKLDQVSGSGECSALVTGISGAIVDTIDLESLIDKVDIPKDLKKSVIKLLAANQTLVKPLLKTFVDAHLTRVFIAIAEKNPPKEGKNSFMVASEKIFEVILKASETIAENPDQDISLLIDDIIRILGLDSKEVFQGIPFSGMIEEFLHKGLKETASKSYTQLFQNPDSQKTKERLVALGVDAGGKALAETLIEDSTQFLIDNITNTLVRDRGAMAHRMKMMVKQQFQNDHKAFLPFVEHLSKLIVQHVPEMMKNKNATAQAALINGLVTPYANALFHINDVDVAKQKQNEREIVMQFLKHGTKHLEVQIKARAMDKKAGGKGVVTHENFVKAAKEMGALHPALPAKQETFNEAIDLIINTINLDKKSRKEIHSILKKMAIREKRKLTHDYNRKIGNLIKANLPLTEKQKKIVVRVNSPSDFAKIYGDLEKRKKLPKGVKEEIEKLVEEYAAIEENPSLQNDHIVNVLGKVLPLTPKQKEALLAATNAEGLALELLVRKDLASSQKQTTDHFYKKVNDPLLNVLFKNGEKDLISLGVPEALSGKAWKLLQDQFVTTILPTLFESMGNETIILQSLVKGLKNWNDERSRVLDALDKGEMEVSQPDSPDAEMDQQIGKCLDKFLNMSALNPVVRALLKDKPQLYGSIGQGIRGQMQGEFLKKMVIDTSLKLLTTRDEKGVPAIKFRDEETTAAIYAEINEALPEEMRKAIDLSVTYFFKSSMAAAKAKWKEIKIKGKGSQKMKHAFIYAWKVITYKIIGAFVLFLFDRPFIKKRLHHFISLEKNREFLTKLISKTPEDQPIAPHILYHENFVYHFVEDILPLIFPPPVKAQDAKTQKRKGLELIE